MSNTVQGMADGGALKGSISDIDKKLEAFNGLATKARMKKFLVELNGTISKLKDQVRHTGNVSELKIRYREHLEKRATKASKPAAAKRAKTTHNGGDKGEETEDNMKDNMLSMLARQLISEPVELSRLILECLDMST
ncbi:hypothetical protein J4E91_009101 [Alternaria rosae]|nr:hypothetical protein J4E91_009101 [Alternaria rosae]